jgi:hypothetical protein
MATPGLRDQFLDLSGRAVHVLQPGRLAGIKKINIDAKSAGKECLHDLQFVISSGRQGCPPRL